MELRRNTSILLDALRAVSAQLVLLGHTTAALRIPLPYFSSNTGLASVEHIGVLIFFILSGFLIAYSIDHKQPTWEQYCIDRFVRIYSGFVPALFFVALVDSILLHTTPESYQHLSTYTAWHWVGTLLMLHRFPLIQEFCKDCLDSFGSGVPFWTLAVEWWLYALYGYVMLGIKRYKWHVNVPVLLLLVISPFHHFKTNITLFWAVGVAIYFIVKYSQGINIKPTQVLVAAFLMAGAAVYRFDQIRYAYDQTFGILVGVCFLLYVLYGQAATFQTPRWIAQSSRVLAAYSFTLYLTHYTCLEALVAWLPPLGKTAMLVCVLAVSHAIAFSLAYFTEMKHQTWRQYTYKWCKIKKIGF